MILTYSPCVGESQDIRCPPRRPGEQPMLHLYFFFQAEDGIRYLTVTGVQTCALPILLGGFIGGRLLATGSVAFSARTRAALTALGLHDLSGLVPREAFSWAALATPRGIVMVVVGGLPVGVGTAYAGGSTSGHAIPGRPGLPKSPLLPGVGRFGGGCAAPLGAPPLP